MADETIDLQTGNQMITNFDVSKIFVFENRYESGTVVNGDYTSMTIPIGTPLGRISGSATAGNPQGLLWPCASLSTDGSEVPVGICAANVVIAEGSSAIVPYCHRGDVIVDKITMFDGRDTIYSVIDSGTNAGKMMYDLLNRLVHLVTGNEQTYLDNQ
jgi:hypothetical protein